MARVYQPIWETLKINKTVSLVASPAAHRRIIKAVGKERDHDIGYKLMIAESHQRIQIRAVINGNLLALNLTIEPLHPSQLYNGAI